jgi:hypothetical protein
MTEGSDALPGIEERLRELEPRRTPLADLVANGIEAGLQPCEALLADLLWFRADPEAVEAGWQSEAWIDEATRIADLLGVHWRSGR